MPTYDKTKLDSPAPPDALATSVSSNTLNPAEFARQLLHFNPDPTQSKLLTEDPHRCILTCSRQWGKSTVTAAKAVHHAHTHPNSLTLVLSPCARQSSEFVRKARSFLQTLNIPTRGDPNNSISIRLPNQSRIIGLPGKEDTIRGFSGTSLLIVDEASRVSDSLYNSIRPSLAASNGQLWILSTPAGRRGFFYNTWISPDPRWTRVTVTADQCSRISPEFLAEQRATMPDSTFRQEYLCEFLDPEHTVYASRFTQAALAVIDPLDILTPGNAPMFPSQFHLTSPCIEEPTTYFGLDLGFAQNFAALCILQRFRIPQGINRATYERIFETVYAVRFLYRFPLGTPYTEIVQRVCLYLRHPSLGRARHLVFDATGAGLPVVELFRSHHPDAFITPVMITAGATPSTDGYIHRIPRKDLLTHLQISFETARIKIAQSLPAAQTLLEELANVRHTFDDAGADVLSRDRTSIHDDLVFATALANWKAIKQR